VNFPFSRHSEEKRSDDKTISPKLEIASGEKYRPRNDIIKLLENYNMPLCRLAFDLYEGYNLTRCNRTEGESQYARLYLPL
jgi:hypothetical protein